MPSSVDQAKSILGEHVLGADEVSAAFGAAPETTPIPFSASELEQAKQRGEALIWRCAAIAGAPITIQGLVERFPNAFEERLLRGSGYALKNEWGILLEPLAQTDTPTNGWALVSLNVLPETLNLAYEDQDAVLAPQGAILAARRRTAVEAVYDTLLFHHARGVRLLERTWDWTSTSILDRGILQVGGFGARGMQILGYSPGTRHGALGVCLTRSAA